MLLSSIIVGPEINHGKGGLEIIRYSSDQETINSSTSSFRSCSQAGMDPSG
jgi:hypothetical protein